MKDLRVVADSSCLIGLAQIKQFDLLKELFLEVYISEAVFEEVVVKGKGEAGSDETKSAINDGWMIKKSVMDEAVVRALSSTLGKGESEVIALYKELEANYALLDETTARDIADIMDVNTMGIIGIIDLAIEIGFNIDKRVLIDKLRDMGFRISDMLYKKMFPDSE
jgi:predicted nucleic acid-binding protein